MNLKHLLISILILSVFSLSSCQENKQGAIVNKPADTVLVLMQTNMGDIELELNRDIAPKTVDNFVGLAMGTKPFTDPITKEQVTRPFYDGLIFHRVINNFMIQGGCPLGNGTGDPGYKFEDEFLEIGTLTGKIDTEAKADMVFGQLIIPYLNDHMEDAAPEIRDIMQRCYQSQSYEPLKAYNVEYFQNLTKLGPVKMVATVDYGTICMANSGPNTNGSQFFIVTNPDGCAWLNGKHTVFGRVINGMDVVLAIQNVATSKPGDRPVEDVKILSVRVM